MMFEVPETALLMTSGFQPRRFAKTYAWIAKVGVAKMQRTFAPDALSFAICVPTSGDVTWYASAATTFEPERPRPSLRLASRSFP